MNNRARSNGPDIDRRRMLRDSGLLAGAAALLTGTRVGRASQNLTPARLAPEESTTLSHQERTTDMVYQIEGRLLEVCTCNTLCPCWVGEDPDGGTCDSSLAYHIDKGTIEGIDVAGRTLALSVHIPGNVLAGNWKAIVYVDDESTEEQEAALLKVFTGQLGGAIADFAGLISDVVAVERVPITFTVSEGQGILTIGDMVEAELEPFLGSTGRGTTLNDTVFSTIPGAPAFPGKAIHYRREDTGQGLMAVNIQGQNAIQGLFQFEA